MASYDEAVPPGRAGHIKVTFDTRRFRGPISRGVTVYSTDPVRPQARLTFKALVRGSVIRLPHPQMGISNVRENQKTAKLLLRKEPTESGKFELTDLTTSASWLKAGAVTLEERRPAGGGMPPGFAGDYLLELRVEGIPEFGATDQTVSFRTGLAREPVVTIPIRAHMSPPFNVMLERVPLTPQEDGSASGTVMFTLRRDLEPADIEVTGEPASIEADVESSGGRHYKLHVHTEDPDLSEGTLTLRVGDEAQRLPVIRASQDS